MAYFRASADKKPKVANKFITSLGSTIQIEREDFSHVRGELQTNSAEMVAFIVS